MECASTSFSQTKSIYLTEWACTHLATPTPYPTSLSPYSFPNLLSLLLYPPWDPWVVQVTAWRPHVWCWSSGRRHKGQHISLSHLAEFQTPTIFDHDFDLHRSIFYNAPKIVKIIIYILYIHRKVSTIYIWAILSRGFNYMVISFQNYKISIYIEIPCQFWISVNENYKIHSHSK